MQVFGLQPTLHSWWWYSEGQMITKSHCAAGKWQAHHPAECAPANVYICWCCTCFGILDPMHVCCSWIIYVRTCGVSVSKDACCCSCRKLKADLALDSSCTGTKVKTCTQSELRHHSRWQCENIDPTHTHTHREHSRRHHERAPRIDPIELKTTTVSCKHLVPCFHSHTSNLLSGLGSVLVERLITCAAAGLSLVLGLWESWYSHSDKLSNVEQTESSR